MRSAPRFQLVMPPFTSLPMMASSEDSTIEASKRANLSAFLCSVTSRNTSTTPATLPLLSRIGAPLSSMPRSVRAGATNLLLSTGSHLGDKPQFTGTLYFHMAGVQQFFEAIREKAEVIWPLETMDYGQKEFGIRDGDGYTLAFAESEEDE